MYRRGGFIIRKCTEQDVVEAGAFYDRTVAWLDAHVNYPKWIYGVYPSEQSVRANVKDDCQYICLEDGEILGAFALNADPQGKYGKASWKKDIPEGDYMILHTLAVSPEAQGKGCGSEVIRFCVSQAKKEGYKALRLDIVPENLPARKFYEKNGFTCAGNADLERGIEDIPIFTLFELNW